MLFLKADGWRLLGFASFGHYCDERLGMSVRAVEQRAALERRLYELPALTQANTVQRRVLERDGWRCQKPGCSRPAAHVHHIEFRAHGGSDDPSNLISVCAAHHLRGIHMGRLRVRGKAPDDLHWEVVG